MTGRTEQKVINFYTDKYKSLLLGGYELREDERLSMASFMDYLRALAVGEDVALWMPISPAPPPTVRKNCFGRILNQDEIDEWQRSLHR